MNKNVRPTDKKGNPISRPKLIPEDESKMDKTTRLTNLRFKETVSWIRKLVTMVKSKDYTYSQEELDSIVKKLHEEVQHIAEPYSQKPTDEVEDIL